MKRIILFILIFIFLFNIMGYVGLYELLKFRNNISIENQIKRGIPHHALVVFAFPLSSLESGNNKIIWTKAGKEFVYNKNRYDLVKKSIKNDSLYLYCVHDTKEEWIIHNYKEAIQKNSNNNTNHRKTNHFYPKIIKDYYFQALNINIFHNISVPVLYSYIDFYNSYSIELPSPPPKYLI